jgi:hypothetical protein
MAVIVAHRFKVSDVEDPDLYAAEPIHEWQQSEVGKWLMENSKPEPVWTRDFDPLTFSHVYAIKGYLTPENYTYWKLKYD